MPRHFLYIASSLVLFTPLACPGQTLYDFGNPNADEQYYIELINRARANPPAEGARLAATTDSDVLYAISQYGVNLTMMQNEFNAIAATPPLAPNANLTASGRSHSTWMYVNNIQDHGSGPTGLAARLTAAGYVYATGSENIYAYSKRPWHGHAGFQIDWGTGGTGGMQSGRGHRTNIHNAAYREIGVGINYGTQTTGSNPVGPTQVTQEFGRQQANPTFGTGVAYYDLDGDNFYDPGEGIHGLTVNIAGVTDTYCMTAAGGGWAIPVPDDAATRAVTFSGLNINQTSDLAFAGSTNAKLDLKLTYSPPFVSSSANAYVGREKTVSFTPVGGATSYKWHRWNAVTAAAENCNTTANITYLDFVSVLCSNPKYEGSYSFQIANSSPAGSRWIELNPIYVGGATPTLSFRSRVGYATTSEKFKVQLKEEGTATWTDVYSQTGTNSRGETSFTNRSPSLAAFANKRFRIRFLLDYTPGSWYSPDNETGWFIDAIQFTGMQQLNDELVTDLGGNTGSFTPTGAGTIVQSINPVISGNEFPATFQTLTVSAGPPPGFATWASNLESSNSLPAGALADPNGDYDKDGRQNLLEYAFGLSPVSASESTPRWPKVVSPNPTTFAVEYQVDTSMVNLTCTPEAGNALSGWYAPGEPGAPEGFSDQLISTAGSIQTRRATLDLSNGAKGFIRMRVIQTE